jgi:hypothetical protein
MGSDYEFTAKKEIPLGTPSQKPIVFVFNF